MKINLKKVLAVFSSVLTTGLLVVTPLSVSADSTLRNGDTNGDGEVNLYDSINICKHMLKSPVLTGVNLQQADYNKDSKVDLYDAIFISRLMLSETKIKDMVAMVNYGRKSEGYAELTFDYALTDAAMKRASELPTDFNGLLRPNGTEFTTILDEYGIIYTVAPANCISAAPETVSELYKAFISKSSIKDKLIEGDYTKIGVGYFRSNDVYKHYWAVMLI